MSVVPNNARFTSGGRQISLASARRIVRVTPEGSASGYNPETNPTIRISLPPSLNFVDTHNSYLQFRIRPTGVDHSKPCRMDENAMSWCSNFTIYGGEGQIIEEIRNYNLLSCLLHKATAPEDYKSSSGRMLQNQGDKAMRNAKMSHPRGAMYCSGLDCSGLLGSQDLLLPLAFCASELVLELTLETFDKCFVGSDDEAGGLKRSYMIDNVEYVAHTVSFSEEYNSKFSQQLQNGIDLSMTTYRTHHSVLTNNQMDLSISQNASSVKSTMHVLRSKDTYNSNEHDSLSTYKSGNIRSIQFDIGGKQIPETPIILEDGGVAQMYVHNQQAFNQFRNLMLGSTITDKTFASTESAKVPNGNHTDSYMALPLKRVYGTFVCNGGSVFKERTKSDGTNDQDAINSNLHEMTINANRKNPLTGDVMSLDNTVQLIDTVPTLTFVPDDARDIHLLEAGLKCKIGVSTKLLPEDETTVNGNTDLAGEQGAFTNLDSINLGLDRYFKSAPAYSAGGVDTKNNQYESDGKNVLYAGSPCPVSWGHTASGAGGNNPMAKRYVQGIGIPMVSGANQPVLSRHKAIGFKGWVDQMPKSDEDFFFACNFETHQESPNLISGSDLSHNSPLHLRVDYQGEGSQPKSFFETRDQSDRFVSFVAIDSVVRLLPNGSLISSI